MPTKEIRSPAKKTLIEFIKNAKPGGEEMYTFEIEGNKDDAVKFVHQMRVELSRLRKRVIEDGGTIKMWKMLLENIEEFSGKKVDEITNQEVDIIKSRIILRRTITQSDAVVNDILEDKDILSELSVG